MTWNQYIAIIAERRIGEAVTGLGLVTNQCWARQRTILAAAELTRAGDGRKFVGIGERVTQLTEAWLIVGELAEQSEVVSMVKWARDRGMADRVPTDQKLRAIAQMNYDTRRGVRGPNGKQAPMPKWAEAS
jgi:hypothetical protein